MRLTAACRCVEVTGPADESGFQSSLKFPRPGYVGVGTVTGPAEPFRTANIHVNDNEQGLLPTLPLKGPTLPLKGKYPHEALPNGEDAEEYLVPVTWEQTRSRDQAVWKKGMFANQNTAPASSETSSPLSS